MALLLSPEPPLRRMLAATAGLLVGAGLLAGVSGPALAQEPEPDARPPAEEAEADREAERAPRPDRGDREILGERLERLLSDPALRRAHVGLAVQVAETGEVLFERDAEKRYVAASATKLVTAAAGLRRLGPEFRWVTRLVAGAPIRDGALQGDLWIRGGGDPRLSGDRIREWASALRESDIERIEGDVVADDRLFPGPQWGRGWMWDDLFGGWAAGVSALQYHPATVRAALHPGTELGDAARLRPRREGTLPFLSTRVRTGPPGSETRVSFLPSADGGPSRLTGWIPSDVDSVSLFLAPTHPTLHFLGRLGEVFADSALPVSGRFRRAQEEEAPRDSTWSADFESEPLGDLLGDLLRPSDNQMAETLLRTLGRVEGRVGSAPEGLAVIEETLADWGIDPGAAALSDGSGLSRYNQLTPNALNRLLRRMWISDDFSTFRDALATPGERGTLRARLLNTPAEENVHAKTGSLSAVRALSGYVTDGDGETLIFTLLINGYETRGPVTNALRDLLVEQLSLYHRPVEAGWPEFRTRDGG